MWVKEREPAVPGSIPDVLGMFVAEVRFYREIAPVVGVRVPACRRAVHDETGTRLELEDLSDWRAGADPVAAARILRGMHDHWTGDVLARWPWLRPPGAGVDLVGELFVRTWAGLAARADLTDPVRRLGVRLADRGVEWAEQRATAAGPATLNHGDASLRNMRTGPDGTVVLLDWEDVSVGAGVSDLAWLLVSSVPAQRWGEVVAGYGPADLAAALPAAAVQGLLSLSDTPVGSADATGWLDRLAAVEQHTDLG